MYNHEQQKLLIRMYQLIQWRNSKSIRDAFENIRKDDVLRASFSLEQVRPKQTYEGEFMKDPRVCTDDSVMLQKTKELMARTQQSLEGLDFNDGDDIEKALKLAELLNRLGGTKIELEMPEVEYIFGDER